MPVDSLGIHDRHAKPTAHLCDRKVRRHLQIHVPLHGHLRLARAGVLDAFFDAYARDTATSPMALIEWVETRYDPGAVAAGFSATKLATLINASIFGRIFGRE